ncbi:unnamed protein product [[Candida] boidinii]|nr:unnamed protein product [[Candida] boidinii]
MRRSELKNGSDEDEDILLQMSVDEVPLVTFKDMLFIRFISSIYNNTLGRLIPNKQQKSEISNSKKKSKSTTKSKESSATTDEDFEILNVEDANPDSNEPSKSSKEGTVLGSKTKKTSSGEKKVLPNGQVIYSRKK